jgi:hypothetical protein
VFPKPPSSSTDARLRRLAAEKSEFATRAEPVSHLAGLRRLGAYYAPQVVLFAQRRAERTSRRREIVKAYPFLVFARRRRLLASSSTAARRDAVGVILVALGANDALALRSRRLRLHVVLEILLGFRRLASVLRKCADRNDDQCRSRDRSGEESSHGSSPSFPRIKPTATCGNRSDNCANASGSPQRVDSAGT